MRIFSTLALALGSLVFVSAQSDLPNLAQLATAEGFSTMVDAASATGLLGALALASIADPLTVFAPTNAAFEALPVGALDYLLSRVNQLSAVLGYHTVRGNFTSETLTNGLMVPTTTGRMLTISNVNDTISIRGANVGPPVDLMASNGVIHALDTVLFPPNFVLPNNIVQAAIADPELTQLVAAVVAAGLSDALVESILTVFAPTDAAFDALPAGVLDYLFENVDLLTDVLLYHVAAGNTRFFDLSNNMEIESLLDDRENVLTIGIDSNDGTVTINAAAATVLTPETIALNGVIHKIDGVLIPPSLVLPPNIYETAVDAGGFDTLIAAIDAAGLVDALASDIFTVFAPTDAAFEALPEGVLDYLLSDAEALGSVLKYHVVSGEFLEADLTDGEMLATIDGMNSVTITVNETVFVDEAMVVGPDVTALNGVIHAIDQVLLPPGFTLPPNIVEVAAGEADLTTLVAAVSAAGLADDLVQSILTVFAPIDSAFDDLPAGVLDYLLANVDMLSSVLLYHVAAGRIMASEMDLVDGLEIDTLLDDKENIVTVGIDANGTVTINDAMVVAADLTAVNGVIHKIDGVLIPSSLELPPNIYETAVAAGGFDTLVAAIQAAGLVDALASDIFTVFAPTDAAFEALPEGLLEYLLEDTNALADVLKYHVVMGETLEANFTEGMLETIDGMNSVTITVNETVFVDEAMVVGPDVTALNGVIHAIDQVLLPPGFTLPPNIVEVAAGEADLTTLVAAVSAAGLADDLVQSILTVFAPIDSAFAALPAGVLDYLLSNTDALANVLLFHVAAGRTMSTDLVNEMEIEVLLDVRENSLTVGIDANGTVTINDATVVAADFSALNGVIHKIDGVLIPPDFVLPPNIYETLVAADGFATLVAAIDAAGLEDALAANILTVFAPTDDAFAALPEGVLTFLLANPDRLAEVLLNHILEGLRLSSDFQDGEEIAPLLEGSAVMVSIVNETLYVNDAAVVDPNITALNGVIHAIDEVLMPVDFMLPPNIAELVEATESLSTLFAALNATGLLDALAEEGPFTVFAPTDAAFAALPNGTLSTLLLEEDLSTLTEILLYHVVSPDLVTLSDIVDGGVTSADTLQGDSVVLTPLMGGMGAMVNTANISEADISALNGFVHLIDEVLIPEDIILMTAAPTAEASAVPSDMPSYMPSETPSASPSENPSETPSSAPSETPSGAPSPSPTAMPSPSPTAAPTPEPVFSFVVSNIDQDREWCLTATRTAENGNLGFRRCDFDGVPDNQQWKFKNGQLISGVDESRCAQIGFGSVVFPGIRMRLGDCDNSLTEFLYDMDSRNIQTDTGRPLCLTNRGNSPNNGDTIHAKNCINRDDYRWDFVVPDE